MTKGQRLRNWSAVCQYPGKKMFVFGTVMLPLDARHDEIVAELGDAYAKVFPFDQPPVFDPIGGIVWFQEEA
ncbi:hypothetical protein [Sphingomonas parapaucimobilis]|uniref:hypothetical protein n=1 Tax=Sphingomonas parapaucimobilis TaxID=28213 RepID=UPI00321B844F